MATRLTPRLSIGIAIACALLPLETFAAVRGTIAGFTEDEARALRRGRAVRRPLEDHERLVGGNAWVVIRAPVSEVWRALNDLATYQRMFRFVDRIELLRSDGQRRTVQIEEGNPLFTLSYILQMRFDEERRDIEFRLDPTTREHVRDAWGFCHLDPLPDGRTLLTYGAAINPGNEMIRALFEDKLERSLLRAPERLKRFIERDLRRRARARRARVRRHRFQRVRRNRHAEQAAVVRARIERRRAARARLTAPPRLPEVPFDFPRDVDCER